MRCDITSPERTLRTYKGSWPPGELSSDDRWGRAGCRGIWTLCGPQLVGAHATGNLGHGYIARAIPRLLRRESRPKAKRAKEVKRLVGGVLSLLPCLFLSFLCPVWRVYLPGRAFVAAAVLRFLFSRGACVHALVDLPVTWSSKCCGTVLPGNGSRTGPRAGIYSGGKRCVLVIHIFSFLVTSVGSGDFDI